MQPPRPERTSGAWQVRVGDVVTNGRSRLFGSPARLAWLAVGVITVAAITWGLLTPAAGAPGAARGTPAVSLTPAPDVGHVAPNVSLLDLSNRQVDVASLHGDVVVLNFWYVACEPCQYEMPMLEKVYHADRGRHLVVVGVNVADDAQTISDFVSKLGIDYPVLRDVGQRAVFAYRVTNTPTSIIIDAQGVVRGREVGAFTDTASIDKLVNPWLPKG
jgi:cytochrome c biogenesis protein CcmG, thiol:disulfide interchange protein DsbE